MFLCVYPQLMNYAPKWAHLWNKPHAKLNFVPLFLSLLFPLSLSLSLCTCSLREFAVSCRWVCNITTNIEEIMFTWIGLDLGQMKGVFVLHVVLNTTIWDRWLSHKLVCTNLQEMGHSNPRIFAILNACGLNALKGLVYEKPSGTESVFRWYSLKHAQDGSSYSMVIWNG